MLACYPAEFRAKFGAEMQSVFYSAVNEVQNANKGQIWRLLWRELQGWPGSVIKEHLRERINKMGSQISLDNPKPLSRLDWLAALLIFILPLAGTALQRIAINYPSWMSMILVVIFLGSIVFALVLVVIRGLPPWSLSYLGLVLTIFTFYGLGIGLWGLLIFRPWMFIFGPRDSWSLAVQLLYGVSMVAFVWFLVLAITLISTYLLKHWPRIQALWRYIRADWTQLSFLVYGGFVFYIWLTFDEYQQEDPWIFGAFTSLAIGAWLYLRAKDQRARIFALVGGVTVAMWIVVIGKWVLIPQQNWPVNLESERIYEPLAAIGSWMVMTIVLIIPALLNLLPPAPGPIVDEGMSPP